MSLLALEKLCGGFALTRPFSSVQLHFWQEISSEVTFFGQLGPAEVADILSGILAGGRRPLARSENQDEVAFCFHWAQSSMTHTGNRAEMEDIENPNLFLFQNFCISTQEDGIYCRLAQLSMMEARFEKRIFRKKRKFSFANFGGSWPLQKPKKTPLDGNVSPFIRLKDFSHLVFLLGLEGDVSSLHQSILGPILVDACSFWKHFVLLVVCKIMGG